MKHLSRFFVLSCLILSANVSNAQQAQIARRSRMANVSVTCPAGRHCDKMFLPASPNAHKTTTSFVRLTGIYDGNGTSAGTYQNHDSSTYSYSGQRMGFDLTGNTPQVLSNGMILLGDYDTATNWSWNATSAVYKPYFRIINAYNAQGQTQFQLFQSASGGTWANSGRTSFYYNAAGNDTLDLGESWNSSTSSWTNSDQDIYTYDAKGNVLTSIYRNWDAASSSWKNYERDTYTYDANNNILTILTEYWSITLNNWRNYSDQFYTYNGANLDQSVTTHLYDTLSGTWKNDYHSVTYYNAANQLIGYVSQNGSGSTWINSDSTSYATLNSGGKPLTTLDFTWNSGAWKPYSRTTTTYSAANLPTMGVMETWNGSAFVNSFRSTTVYNNYDKPTNVFSEAWNGSAWIVNTSCENKRYYYQEVTTAVGSSHARVLTAYLYPVPANDRIILSAHLPGPQTCRGGLYDALGRQLMQWTDKATEFYVKEIPVSGLPAGVYYLRLQGADNAWSQSFTVRR